MYLTKVYLHEIGHTKAYQDDDERFADRYAWQFLYEKFDKEDMIKTLLFFWFYESLKDKL